MSSAAATTITSPAKTGKSATNLGAANLGSAFGTAGGGMPPTGTVISGTPGGNRPILITNRFELLQRLECDAVAN